MGEAQEINRLALILLGLIKVGWICWLGLIKANQTFCVKEYEDGGEMDFENEMDFEKVARVVFGKRVWGGAW